ncbi:hypothetical protein K469DRAFT_708188 [Zopfia rhizophila CBS 207.26]|uniref:Transposase IS30-like HTH domain-containing protein n=1 Tax=Zopfia rhizophila CBS 207.26 TaxID=1314779 RepID=A0A6A6D7T8_9PEZI|nr:hypothetical protein K469DRAFT_708188 [Zopfia rhizophila CBS 207.26]
MPNIIRRRRSRPPERQSSRASDSGTHLTYEERWHIYSLSQYSRCSQRAIASTLQLPRSTVQSAIYAMTRTSRKRQDRKPTLTTPVRRPAPHIATQIRSDVRQPYPPSAAPTVPSSTTPIPEDHHRQPPQPAVAASSWNSGIERNVPTNGLHDPWVSLSAERCDLHHQFSTHNGASVGPSLPPNPPKPMPIEPRVVYQSSMYHTTDFATPDDDCWHWGSAQVPPNYSQRASTYP